MNCLRVRSRDDEAAIAVSLVDEVQSKSAVLRRASLRGTMSVMLSVRQNEKRATMHSLSRLVACAFALV
jgi:hypothetical protein